MKISYDHSLALNLFNSFWLVDFVLADFMPVHITYLSLYKTSLDSIRSFPIQEKSHTNTCLIQTELHCWEIEKLYHQTMATVMMFLIVLYFYLRLHAILYCKSCCLRAGDLDDCIFRWANNLGNSLDTYLHDNHEVAGTGISHSFSRHLGSWLLSKRARVKKVVEMGGWALPADFQVSGKQRKQASNAAYREWRYLKNLKST